jgi:ribonuclease VapC
MVIDSSALIALLLDEPETVGFVTALAAAPTRLLSAPSHLETAIVMMGRWGPDAVGKLDRLLDELSIVVVPFSREQAVLAIAALPRIW